VILRLEEIKVLDLSTALYGKQQDVSFKKSAIYLFFVLFQNEDDEGAVVVVVVGVV